MDSSTSAVVVAVIAGIVSVAGALASISQANRARKSAQTLDSRAHRIARIDAKIEEMREAYRQLMHDFGEGNKVRAAASAEVLAVSQGATQKLAQECRSLSSRWVGKTAKLLEALDDSLGKRPIRDVSAAYWDAQRELANERERQTTE